MKFRVLGAFGSDGPAQRPSAFLVNDRVLVDAGSVGASLTVPEQVEIQHALLSHCHLDHLVGLAFLADCLAMVAPERCLTACGIAPVVETLRTHVFNNHVWPDFTAIPSREEPSLRLRTLHEEAESRVGHLWVRPIPVSHTIPTTGFIVHDGETGFVYSGDTGPTSRLWEAAREMRGLKAVVVETTFPNRLGALARISGHLTPEMLVREMDKMPDLPVWVYHVKPQFYEETAEELARIDSGRIEILEQGKTYSV